MSLVTAAEAQAWVRIPDPSATQFLSFAIKAASAAVERYCARQFAYQDYIERYDGTGTSRLVLNQWPIDQVTQVMINDVEVPDNLRRLADREVILTGGVFAPGHRNVEVAYLAGYISVPEDVKLATLFAVQAMINARSADPNVMAESAGGVYSTSYGPFGPGALPLNARQLLEPYRNRWLS